MRKILLSFLVLGLLLSSNFFKSEAFAQSYGADSLSIIEERLFNQSYNQEDITNRLSKIENIVYGQSFDSFSTQQRINRINQILPVKERNDSILPERADSNSENVDTNHIPGLLSEIESQEVQPALPPRKETIFTEFNNANPADTAKNNKRIENFYNNSNHLVQKSGPDANYYQTYDLMGGRLGEVEMKVFGKKYEGDICLNRIDRLEKKVFGKASFGLIEERLDKIEDKLSGTNKSITVKPGSKGLYSTDNLVTPQYQPPYQNISYNNRPDSYRQQASQNNMNTVLSGLESTYLGTSYDGLDPNLRLKQLESMMFGQIYNGNINYRMKRLMKAAMGKKVPSNVVNNIVNPRATSIRNLARNTASDAVDNAIGDKGGILGDIGKSFGQTMIQSYSQNY